MSDIAPTKAFWFRIGYALERARQTVSTRADLGREALDAAAGQAPIPIPVTPRPAHDDRAQGPGTATGSRASVPARRDPFSEAAASWVERQVASRLLAAKNPGYLALGRAALAGAGAELAAVVVRAALLGPTAADPGPGPEGLGTLAEGAAEGMVYASFVRPFVPGPLWTRGSAFGLVRYFAASGGGLPQVLGSLSPHRQIPGFDSLIAPRTGGDTWAEHLAAGLVLAALYESSERSRGTNPGSSD